MKILGVIPSRYASTRFPAKSLVDIGGKTMVQRVYEQASKADCLDDVIVATDHEAIMSAVTDFGGKAVLTSENHVSGTDRCYEALSKTGNDYDYVINIQGDEPFIAPVQIDLLGRLLDGNTEIATLIKQISSEQELFDPNVVKVVKGNDMKALYFSRSTIPYLRNMNKTQWLDHHTFFKHIGMYAYRSDILKKLSMLETSPLEQAESLEQLRWLQNGYSIKTNVTDIQSIGIDRPEDLSKIKHLI